MIKTESVAEVQRAGIVIESEEAVAIAQQLIGALCRSDRAGAAEPPYGPPTASTVFLEDDGSVVCRTCEATPAVSEVAFLLQAMLPPQTRAPGGLRYTIARAVLDVDVPPFDTLEEFSDTLRRYERGPRDVIIARLMQRFAARRALAPRAMVNRRQHPRTTELRRALREADARLYLQKVAADALAQRAAAGPARRPHSMRAGIACVAAGLVLIAAGEFVDVLRDPPAVQIAAPIPNAPAPLAVRDVSLPREPAATIVDASSRDDDLEARTLNPERRIRVRAPHRPRQVVRTQPTRSAARKGRDGAAPRSVLEKLRLKWLRNVLTSL